VDENAPTISRALRYPAVRIVLASSCALWFYSYFPECNFILIIKLYSEFNMKRISVVPAFVVIAAAMSPFGLASADTVTQRGFKVAQVCEQVISCGTKNGVRKEYPTPCAARDDGATDIRPKTGPTCAAADK
jgi:hypothetical protein